MNTNILVQSAISGAAFAGLDALFLGVITKSDTMKFFQQVNCGKPPQLNLYIGAVVWFVLGFLLERFVFPMAKTRKQAVLLAALLGGLVYAVYDLTNLATLSRWTVAFAVRDIAWGAVASAIVAYVRYR